MEYASDREFLAHGGARRVRLAAVHGDRVVAAVLVPVVVLEPQPAGGARQDPGAAVVVADMEGHPDLRGAALAHVHDQRLALEGIIGLRRLVGDDLARERLAAVRGEALQEGVRRVRRGGGVGAGERGPGHGGQEGGGEQARDHRRCFHAPDPSAPGGPGASEARVQ
jgi:hypothetical protein